MDFLIFWVSLALLVEASRQTYKYCNPKKPRVSDNLKEPLLQAGDNCTLSCCQKDDADIWDPEDFKEDEDAEVRKRQVVFVPETESIDRPAAAAERHRLVNFTASNNVGSNVHWKKTSAAKVHPQPNTAAEVLLPSQASDHENIAGDYKRLPQEGEYPCKV